MTNNQCASNQLNILSFIEATRRNHYFNQLEPTGEYTYDINTSTTSSSLTSDLDRDACGPSCKPSIFPNLSLTNYTVHSVVKTADNPCPSPASHNAQPG